MFVVLIAAVLCSEDLPMGVCFRSNQLVVASFLPVLKNDRELLFMYSYVWHCLAIAVSNTLSNICSTNFLTLRGGIKVRRETAVACGFRQVSTSLVRKSAFGSKPFQLTPCYFPHTAVNRSEQQQDFKFGMHNCTCFQSRVDPSIKLLQSLMKSWVSWGPQQWEESCWPPASFVNNS